MERTIQASAKIVDTAILQHQCLKTPPHLDTLLRASMRPSTCRMRFINTKRRLTLAFICSSLSWGLFGRQQNLGNQLSQTPLRNSHTPSDPSWLLGGLHLRFPKSWPLLPPCAVSWATETWKFGYPKQAQAASYTPSPRSWIRQRRRHFLLAFPIRGVRLIWLLASVLYPPPLYKQHTHLWESRYCENPKLDPRSAPQVSPFPSKILWSPRRHASNQSRGCNFQPTSYTGTIPPMFLNRPRILAYWLALNTLSILNNSHGPTEPPSKLIGLRESISQLHFRNSLALHNSSNYNSMSSPNTLLPSNVGSC